MKRIGVIGAILLVFPMISCLKRNPMEALIAPGAMVEKIVAGTTDAPPLSFLTAQDSDFARFVEDYYRLDISNVLDGAICYADGAESFEIAVLAFSDVTAAKNAEPQLRAYKDSRASVFEGYAPLQASLVKNGIVVVSGRHVALLICPKPQSARDAFLKSFAPASDEGTAHALPFSQQGANFPDADFSEKYDSAAVLSAWKSGDTSFLDRHNRFILDSARDTISKIITKDMSDFEKERAVHDWMTDWASFDSSVFGRGASIRKNSDTPYGFFADKRAMCHGYSSTFQLFMDMLGIECITVVGTPGGNVICHSWNQVKLDGEWYGVDTAWDDPIGGRPTKQFFNVTSRTLRSSGIHHWDESSVPEARGTKYCATFLRQS